MEISKKRKFNEIISLEPINENDFEKLDLNEYKKELWKLETYYTKKIQEIKNQIKETNRYIAKKCKNKNGDHEWISERENCMYGEKYTLCKKCRVDYYDKSYIHSII